MIFTPQNDLLVARQDSGCPAFSRKGYKNTRAFAQSSRAQIQYGKVGKSLYAGMTSRPRHMICAGVLHSPTSKVLSEQLLKQDAHGFSSFHFPSAMVGLLHYTACGRRCQEKI
jgi:hypothetical protein